MTTEEAKEKGMMPIRLKRVTNAVLALAQANIPADVQQLLLFGDPMRGIPPDALGKAIDAALSEQHEEPSRG